jgi:hypothetical protein
MAQTDVLRPISIRKAGQGTAVPGGTLDSVTSDDSDATYIEFDLIQWGENWNLRVESHTPPANHERHRIRGRIRVKCDSGTATEDIDLGRDTESFIEYDSVPVNISMAEQAGSWYQNSDYGLDTPGALSDLNIGGGWPYNDTGGMSELNTSECYIDIDCREQPDYSPEVRDAAGVDRSGGTVTDTNQPTLHFGGVGYDGLPELDWEVSAGAFSDSGSGVPPTSVQVTSGLADGSYVATFTVRSTIRGADPFEHTQYITFDVANTVPPPSPPIMTVVEEFGGYRISWSDPGGAPWDDDYVVAEIWREDCTGSSRIAVIEDGLNGTYLDLAIPQLDPQACMDTEPCDITYRIRYWGYVSELVELPSTLPSDLILAWPGTVASIPSGWSRVTALDGRYPIGSTGTGAPSTTGGSSNHNHTTSGHRHVIGSHRHTMGGYTGSSNDSTVSARFSGASQSQADQPHYHARPSYTGYSGSGYSGYSSPGTSTEDNEPPTREVIWIEGDGARTEYPVGVLGWSTENISGWTDDTSSDGRFLKGAGTGADGGSSYGSSTHTHTVNSHNHSGFDHDHDGGYTGLSYPVGVNAGYGSSSPKWLPRHTHPINVYAGSTGNLSSGSGGTSSSVNLEPLNRRLRVMENTGGGVQTRIIGLYMGDLGSLDPLLTPCDGTDGTPDMRGWFCRDEGSNSVNSTGGSSSHNHTTPSHTHGISSHDHGTNIWASTTGSFDRPTYGDLGYSPTTDHDHSTADTGNATPSRSSVSSGNTSSSSHVPPYHDAHFVRLDGTISGGPLPVPELKVSEYASMTVPSFTYDDGLDRLSTGTEKMAVVTDRNHDYPRLVGDSVPLDGGLHTVSSTPAGEDVTLAIAVEGLPAIDALEELLSADYVYYSPVGGTPGWYAPGGWSVSAPAPEVKVLRVTMVRVDWPSTPDPEDYL